MAKKKWSHGWGWRLGAWAALAMAAWSWLGAGGQVSRAEEPAQAEEKQVTVEAEGAGATEMEALQNAWMEAVRQGVGMFMAAKTELIDNRLTEKIVTHSKGQVRSYEIIGKSQDGQGVRLKIKARIDKDILQETAKAVKSQKVAFDGKDLAAQKVTQQEKQKSAAEVWKEIEPLLDFRQCLKYRFMVEKVTLPRDLKINDKEYKQGSDFIFGNHILTWDLDKFQEQKTRLEKLVEQVATNKQEIQYAYPDLNRSFLALAKQYGDPQFHIDWTNQLPKRKDLIGFWTEDGKCAKIFDDDWNTKYAFTIVKNTAIGHRYYFGKKDDPGGRLDPIVPVYSLQFYITNDEGLESIALYSRFNTIYVGVTRPWDSCRIAPVFQHQQNSSWYCHTIDCIQPLMELTPEQLTNIKSLNAGYTLKRITK